MIAVVATRRAASKAARGADRGVWRDPRHIVLSLAVATVGLLVMSPPLVEAALGVNEEPIFVFAERRVGDQGTYRQWALPDGGTPALAMTSVNWQVMAWRWDGPAVFPTGHNRSSLVNVLEIDVEGQLGDVRGQVLFEPGTFKPLAIERYDRPTGPFPPFLEVIPPSVGPLAWRGLHTLPATSEANWGCMHSMPLEGTKVYASTERLLVRHHCFGPATYGWPDELPLILDRIEQTPEGKRLHAHVEHPGLLARGLEFVFQEGIPEPVLVTVRWSQGLNPFVLDGFVRGTGPPLATVAAGTEAPWRTMGAFGDDERYPLPDGGSSLDFPFSTAIAAAAAHQACGAELEAFTARHPQAFVFAAQSSTHERDDGAIRRAWWFRLGDRDAGREFEVSLPLLDGGAADCWWQEIAYSPEALRPGFFDPQVEWPTAKTLLDAYNTISGAPFPAEDVGWSVGCPGPCGQDIPYLRQVRAGRLHFPYDVDASTTGGPAALLSNMVSSATLTSPSGIDMHLMAWSNTASPWVLQGMAHAVPANDPSAAPAAEPPATAEAGPAVLEAGSVAFDWTSARVAWWVTLLGGVAGVVYYLLPVVRASPLLSLFSRVRQEDLLRSDARQRIHDTIRVEPGIHLRQLSRRTRMPVGTVRHHVAKLVEAQLVVGYKQGRYTCYSSAKDGPKPAVKGATAAALLQVVAASPGIRQAEVARRLGVTPATVHRHVTRLCEQGLLTVHRQGHAAILTVA